MPLACMYLSSKFLQVHVTCFTMHGPGAHTCDLFHKTSDLSHNACDLSGNACGPGSEAAVTWHHHHRALASTSPAGLSDALLFNMRVLNAIVLDVVVWCSNKCMVTTQLCSMQEPRSCIRSAQLAALCLLLIPDWLHTFS